MKNSRTKIYSNSITYERKKVEEFNKKCYDINEINKDDNINLYFNVLFNHWFRLFIRIFLHQNFPYSHVMLLFLVPLSLPLLLNFRLSYLLTSVLHFHR